jgi:hypothetical protein
MTFAVLIYGEFRTFDINLPENLKELFGEITCPIDFYILTEECSEYAEKKQKICQMISSFGYRINYFETLESCSEYDSMAEQSLVDDYNQIPYNRERDGFTPRLYYRRCLVNQVMNKMRTVEYDRVILARPFDMIYKRCKSIAFLNNPEDKVLYYGVDSLFIGTPKDINHLLEVRFIRSILVAQNDPYFRTFFSRNDHYLAKIMPLCLEMIYQCLLFTHFLDRSKNLRYDYTRFGMAEMWNKTLEDPTSREEIIDYISPFIQDDYLFILHCPRRK